MGIFYFDVIFRLLFVLLMFFVFVKGFDELVVVMRKSKFLFSILGIVFYFIILSIFSNIGWIQPILSESKLSQLEISEGIGRIYHTSKANHLYLHNIGRSLYFDFSLCIPYIEKRTLQDQHLKIWHKGKMVYQLSKNGEIVFSIEKVNSNIDIYNKLEVPLNYLLIVPLDFYICLVFAYFKMKLTKRSV